MVWGCFYDAGKGAFAFLDGRITVEGYMEVMETHLMPFAYCFHGTHEEDFTFMHDNARPHLADSVRNWLQNQQIATPDWPAY